VAGINELEAEQAIQQAIPAAVAALAPPAPVPGSTEPKSAAPEESASQAASQSPNAAQQPNTATNPNPPPLPRTIPPVGSAKQRSRLRSTGPRASGGISVAEPPPPPPPVVRLPATPMVVHTYTRDQLASGQLPPSEWGHLLAHSYSPNGGWYVMVIPEAYQMETLKSGTTHFSPWSYDRHVPLGFYGAPFTPGIYHGRVQPVDLAATLASVLGVTQPSASVGTVLTQIIRIPPPLPALRGAKGGHRREGAPDTAPAPSTAPPAAAPAPAAPTPNTPQGAA
jgi:hypothetical protein